LRILFVGSEWDIEVPPDVSDADLHAFLARHREDYREKPLTVCAIAPLASALLKIEGNASPKDAALLRAFLNRRAASTTSMTSASGPDFIGSISK
jgi:hypothetical protein